MQDPSLQCQWTAEDLERHGRPCRHYWLHLQNQSDVWGSIMTRFPPGPVAEKSHPRSAIMTRFLPGPVAEKSHPRSEETFTANFLIPPPPPPCTNLTFTVPPVPAHLSDDQPCCSCFFSLPLHPPPPPPPPVKVCACCVYCHDEVVHQCSMLSGDPAGPPHGT